MPDKPSALRRFPLPLVVGFALLVAMIGGSLYLTRLLSGNMAASAAISEYRRAITDVIGAARDAEIGQRGYLLTDDPKYLAPYEAAVGTIPPALTRVSQTGGARGAAVARTLQPIVDAKLNELSETIALTKGGQRDDAMAIVRTNRGKALMDRLRTIFEGERRWAIGQTDQLSAQSAWTANLLTYGLAVGLIALFALSMLWLGQARWQFSIVDAARKNAESTLAALRSEVVAREAAEDTVRQMQKMEAVGQLTGGIAHDFNNMLAVVMGGLELAKRRLDDDPARLNLPRIMQYLDNAREGAARAAALTARLLAFSRQQPLAPKPIDANKLIGGMAEMLERTLGDAIAVETVTAGGLWRCYADPGELENALLNLAVNARDAMPAGGKLTIETVNAHLDDNYARMHAEIAPGQYVAICVTDSGTGMAPDVIERAFDPFFTTKSVGKGTGLGLSQVFGFAKQTAGHVAIYSEMGQGTTVKLYLPRFIGADIKDAEGSQHESVPTGVASEIILVVEDEHRVRHFAVDALRELGYTAISAASPAEALNVIAGQPEISMLFTDIVMPDMNGRQLADLARQIRADLKVLYTTGYTRNAVVHNGMVDVGVAFLSKPYTLIDLGRKVRQVLDGGGVNRPF